MNFIEANQTVILQKYATFTGRARRAEFWWFALLYIISYIVLSLIDVSGNNILPAIFALAVLIPSIALGVRRLHDIEMSGWWYLIMLIPLVNIIFWIYIGVKPGTPGQNQYGEDPVM